MSDNTSQNLKGNYKWNNERLIDFNGMSTWFGFFVLWHINLCGLFNA